MRFTTLLRRALPALGLAAGLNLAVLAATTAQAAEPPAGQLQKVTVHGASLAGNLSGDAADREVYVYLPPSYATAPGRRYPVVYYLHGFGVHAERYVAMLGWPGSIDRAIAAGTMREMIVVMPNALTPYGGSMYSNSVTTGDWEAFVARDLVGHVDANYRTLARREARGLAGHSMGGYGTLRIGMKYPDTFVALYAMSSCCLDPRDATPQDAALEKLTSREEVEKMTPFARTTLASSAAWAGNATRPPFFMDLPTLNGEVQPAVVAQYAANAPVAMASQYARQLKGYRAIMMDIGLQDRLIAGNEALRQALQRLGVPHQYETYEGDHGNKVAERVGKLVLPFFSKQLSSE